MSDLKGTVSLSRALASHPFWGQEKFCQQAAWIDLLLLANNRPGTARVGKHRVELLAGDVGWSLEGLARRWMWSGEKVRSWLLQLQDDGRIRLTLKPVTHIRLVNYRLHNPTTDYATENATENATDYATENATEPEKLGRIIGAETGNGKREYPPTPLAGGLRDASLRGPNPEPDRTVSLPAPAAPNLHRPPTVTTDPTDAEIYAWAAAFPGELSSGLPGPIPVEFVDRWLAKMTGRRDGLPRLWDRALVSEYRVAFRSGGKENAPLPRGDRSVKPPAAGKPPEPAWRELQQLDEAIAEHPLTEGCAHPLPWSAALEATLRAMEKRRDALREVPV